MENSWSLGFPPKRMKTTDATCGFHEAVISLTAQLSSLESQLRACRDASIVHQLQQQRDRCVTRIQQLQRCVTLSLTYIHEPEQCLLSPFTLFRSLRLSNSCSGIRLETKNKGRLIASIGKSKHGKITWPDLLEQAML